MNNLTRLYKAMVSTIEMNMAYLESQLIITRIVSKLDKRESFLIKFIDIEFHRHCRIGSCLRDS